MVTRRAVSTALRESAVEEEKGCSGDQLVIHLCEWLTFFLFSVSLANLQ